MQICEITGSAFTLSSVLGTLHDPKLPSKCYGGDLSESLKSGVNDVIVVRQSDGTLKSTPLQARVGKLSGWRTLFKSREGKKAKLYVNNIRSLSEQNLILSDSGSVFIHQWRSVARCSFTNDEIQTMALNEGINEALLVVEDLDIELTFKIHLLSQDNRLVITDIDGTITSSDVSGFIGGSIGVDVTHSGVVEFFDKVSSNGYIVVYLTARPMLFDSVTREYVFNTLQNIDSPTFVSYSMPRGPLFLSPISAEAALTADAEVMKLSTLKSILDLFNLKQDVVAGAYGNKNSDTEAYLNSGIRGGRIFLINEDSQILNVETGNNSSYKLQALQIDKYYPIK